MVRSLIYKQYGKNFHKLDKEYNMAEMNTVVNRPDAGRLIEGMRDTGYDFKTAIADIIDNSIAAEATKIDVSMNLDPSGEIFIHILDDGIGMTKDELILAMRYGAQARPHPQSLGKFGLGLKTASTAFCRRLVVISKDQE